MAAVITRAPIAGRWQHDGLIGGRPVRASARSASPALGPYRLGRAGRDRLTRGLRQLLDDWLPVSRADR